MDHHLNEIAVSDRRTLGLSNETVRCDEEHGSTEQFDARLRTLCREVEVNSHIRVAGWSTQWRNTLKLALQVAVTDSTVLLTGESGTGKEVVARFIHRASGRSHMPFVALNCAAIPENLLESELFGHERGAFTSAQQSKPGQIELAAGGVLFLDEVAELRLPAQATLLRVLQEREFQRLGGTRTLKADVRVVTATNRDLDNAVESGVFREDLYYRLNVFDIAIAPLRERRDDILPMCEAFLEEIARSFRRPQIRLSRSARDAMLRHHWPGNVRELRNSLERAAILCEGSVIDAEHLSLRGIAKSFRHVDGGPTDLSVVERDTIARVLIETHWNKVRAATRLGLSRTQLYGRLKKYGLEPSPRTEISVTAPAPSLPNRAWTSSLDRSSMRWSPACQPAQPDRRK